MENEKRAPLLEVMERLKNEGVTKSERAEAFYNNHLIPQLSEDVLAAEIARQDCQHEQVSVLDEKWRGEDNQKAGLILEKLAQRNQELQTVNKVKIGLAGMGRITHVDHNTQFNQELIDQDKLRQIIKEVHRLYDLIELDKLPGRTIHGGPIIWPAETAQDNFRTAELLREDPAEIIAPILAQLFNNRNQLEQNGVNLQKKTGSLEDRQQLTAVLYALAVIQVRSGRLRDNLNEIQSGLSCAEEAFRGGKNPHRLATLAKWALEKSLQTQRNGEIVNKQPARKLKIQALRCLVKAFIASPKETLTALKPS